MTPEALPDILEVHVLQGADAALDAPPDVLIEVPHGATTRAHFDTVRGWLTHSEVPPDIDAFYWVNTDLGAPEYALRFAQMLTEHAPHMTVLVLRGIVPRTFADLNRVWESASGAFQAAGLNRAVPDFIHDADRPVLERAHRAYQEAVEAAYAHVLSRPGTMAFNLHTYAPISVAARPDEPVLTTLRRAYARESYPQQVRRPTGQLITARKNGPETADPALVEAVLGAYSEAGIEMAHNTPFQLHEVTTLDARAHAWPGRVLSMELSREALAAQYAPFVPLEIDPASVERLTAPLAEGFHAWSA